MNTQPGDHSYRHHRPAAPFAPSGPGGITMLGPNRVQRGIPPPQEYYCVRIALISGDPNSNGGLDSNGYYVGYLEGMRFANSLGTNAPQVRVTNDAGSGPYSANNTYAPRYTNGSRVMCYGNNITVGSPTSSDDGFMLLVPMQERAACWGTVGVNSGGLTGGGTLSAGTPGNWLPNVAGECFGMHIASGNRLTAYNRGWYWCGFEGLATSGGVTSGTAGVSTVQWTLYQDLTAVISQPIIRLGEAISAAYSGSDSAGDTYSGTAKGYLNFAVPFSIVAPALFDPGDFLTVGYGYSDGGSGTGALSVEGFYWMQWMAPG